MTSRKFVFMFSCDSSCTHVFPFCAPVLLFTLLLSFQLPFCLSANHLWVSVGVHPQISIRRLLDHTFPLRLPCVVMCHFTSLFPQHEIKKITLKETRSIVSCRLHPVKSSFPAFVGAAFHFLFRFHDILSKYA